MLSRLRGAPGPRGERGMRGHPGEAGASGSGGVTETMIVRIPQMHLNTEYSVNSATPAVYWGTTILPKPIKALYQSSVIRNRPIFVRYSRCTGLPGPNRSYGVDTSARLQYRTTAGVWKFWPLETANVALGLQNINFNSGGASTIDTSLRLFPITGVAYGGAWGLGEEIDAIRFAIFLTATPISLTTGQTDGNVIASPEFIYTLYPDLQVSWYVSTFNANALDLINPLWPENYSVTVDPTSEVAYQWRVGV